MLIPGLDIRRQTSDIRRLTLGLNCYRQALPAYKKRKDWEGLVSEGEAVRITSIFEGKTKRSPSLRPDLTKYQSEIPLFAPSTFGRPP